MRRLVLAIALLAACGDDDSGGTFRSTASKARSSTRTATSTSTCGLLDDSATCRMIYNGHRDRSEPGRRCGGRQGHLPPRHRDATCSNGIGGTLRSRHVHSQRQPRSLRHRHSRARSPAAASARSTKSASRRTATSPSCPDACCQGTCVGDTPPVRPHVGEACAPRPPAASTATANSTTAICVPVPRRSVSPCTYAIQCAERLVHQLRCATRYPGPGEACSTTDVARCAATSVTSAARPR